MMEKSRRNIDTLKSENAGKSSGRRKKRFDNPFSGSMRLISGAWIGKWILVVLLVVYAVLLLWYTSGSTKPFETVSGAVEHSLRTENLAKKDGQALKRYYGLNSADYNGVLYYSSESSISAEEVLMIEAKSEAQVQTIRDAVETRLSNRKADFSEYAPKQAMMIEQAVILVRGKYIFVAVSPDAQEYADIFTKSL